MKQKVLQKYTIFSFAAIMALQSFFVLPAFAEAKEILIAQGSNANNAISSTTDKGIVQCGNDDNIRKGTADKPSGTCTLYDLFNTGIRVVNMLMLAAGVFAVVRIVMAGFSMVISAGNEERLSAGKSGLTNALLGLFIVLVAYLLINTIFTLLVDNGGSILKNPIDFIKS